MLKKLLSAVTGAMLIISIPIAGFAAERYEILQVGDEDAWVMELQNKLNELGYLKVPATGFYGTNTQNAVISYQRDHGLTVDGKAGPVTRKDLFGDEYREIDGPRTSGQDSILVAPGKPSTTSGDIVAPDEPEASAVPSATVKPSAEPESAVSTPAPTKDNTQSGSADTVLQLGDKGEAISELQRRLREYDYYDYGSITGYFGPVTKDAVIRFQHTYGLTEDGIVGPEAQAILDSDAMRYYTLKTGDRGDDVSRLQTRLRELGYLSGSVTGYYGDVTQDAVSRFQENNGLDADGTAGKDTRGVLFSDDALAASSTADEEEPLSSPTSVGEAEQTDEPDASAGPSADPDGDESEASAAPTAKPTAKPTDKPAGGSLDKFISIAKGCLGKSYVYGAVGPNSFDCSGFVYYALKGAGVGVSRLSSAGYASYSSWKTITSKDDLKQGDLVFFRSDSSSSISHVGIYLGGGNFIHAAPSLDGVGYSTMSSGYYSRNFQSAKRVF